jgi:hypothetical protein
MVSIQLKQRDGDCLLLQMLSESSLTQMEYMRFTLHCSMKLRGAFEYLIAAERGSSPCRFSELEGKIGEEDREDLQSVSSAARTSSTRSYRRGHRRRGAERAARLSRAAALLAGWGGCTFAGQFNLMVSVY